MRRLILLIIALPLWSCTALMVGGGTSGGYKAGNDERSTAESTSDRAITAAIGTTYAADSQVSLFDIDVHTNNGRVTLSGTVDSYAVRETAEKLALATNGAKSVNNQIEVAYAR